MNAKSIIFAVAAIVATMTQASATQIFDPTASSCTGINCSSVVLGGTVNSAGATAGPWTISVFALNGECLRLDVTTATRDLETVVVGPNGAIWRNDDSIGNRPIVRFVAPHRGWYTVSISEFAGRAVEADFQLAYGRYTGAGNANCAGPTVSASAEPRIAKPQGDGGSDLIPNSPTSGR